MAGLGALRRNRTCRLMFCAAGCIRSNRIRPAPTALGEARDDVLRREGFLTETRSRGLHVHDDATVVVDQVVVVIRATAVSVLVARPVPTENSVCSFEGSFWST